MIFHYIYHLRHKRPCLPSEGRSWLEYDTKIGVFILEILKDTN